MSSRLEQLSKQISSGKWEDRLIAINEVVDVFGTQALEPLLGMLKSSSSITRNAAALAIKDIGDDTAVEHLFKAIKSPANREDRSTLVYALENLDCRDHFLDVIDLTLAPKSDVRLSAINILFNQGFNMSDQDLKSAFESINSALERGYEKEWIELLKSRLADFL